MTAVRSDSHGRWFKEFTRQRHRQAIPVRSSPVMGPQALLPTRLPAGLQFVGRLGGILQRLTDFVPKQFPIALPKAVDRDPNRPPSIPSSAAPGMRNGVPRPASETRGLRETAPPVRQPDIPFPTEPPTRPTATPPMRDRRPGRDFRIRRFPDRTGPRPHSNQGPERRDAPPAFWRWARSQSLARECFRAARRNARNRPRSALRLAKGFRPEDPQRTTDQVLRVPGPPAFRT